MHTSPAASAQRANTNGASLLRVVMGVGTRFPQASLP
jgi:hypothetical protein